MNTINILFVGVGGQGVLLASTITADVALKAGYDVKKSEIHGMSQRGGIVTSHLRFGEKIHSPLIKVGDADILVAFEQAEGLRWAHFVKPDGIIIVDTYKIIPPLVAIGMYQYPDDIMDRLMEKVKKVYIIPAFNLASDLGNPILANTIILGKLSSLLDIPEKIWESAIEENVPEKAKEINIKAFYKGRSIQ
jgi:indolepyruvate ferredoxin oxidoreductase beta subunit